MGTHLLQMSPDVIAARYPWLGIPTSTQLGLLQTKNAGHMSPRLSPRREPSLVITPPVRKGHTHAARPGAAPKG